MASSDNVPTITGLVPSQDFATGTVINPFSTVTIADPNPDATIAVQISTSDQLAPGTLSDASGDLTGAGLTVRKAGVYELSGTADQVTQQLQSLLFQPDYTQPALNKPLAPITTDFSLEVVDQTDGTGITSSINTEIVQDAYRPPSDFLVANAAGPAGFVNGSKYTGPVPGIAVELDYAHKPGGPATDPDLDVIAFTPNTFIVTGNGMDGIDVAAKGGGNNVLDGGGGSNFLTGGAGNDTFYVDGRNPATNVWSTVSGFHAGDSATIWGVTAQDFKLTWLDNQGAAGFTGLTAVFEKPGQGEIGITLAGFSSADLSNGRLSLSYGQTQDQPGAAGATYLHIAAA